MSRSYSQGRVFKHPQSPFWYSAFSIRGVQVRKSTGLIYDKETNLNERKAREVLRDQMVSIRKKRAKRSGTRKA